LLSLVKAQEREREIEENMMILLCSKKSKRSNKCTLHEGHKGKHIATQVTETIIETWEEGDIN